MKPIAFASAIAACVTLFAPFSASASQVFDLYDVTITGGTYSGDTLSGSFTYLGGGSYSNAAINLDGTNYTAVDIWSTATQLSLDTASVILNFSSSLPSDSSEDAIASLLINGTSTPIAAGAYVQDAPSAAPLPAALPLLATGLGAMGLFGWRRNRKRKNAAALAAA